MTAHNLWERFWIFSMSATFAEHRRHEGCRGFRAGTCSRGLGSGRGGDIGEGGHTHWSGSGTCVPFFGTRDPKLVEQKKVLIVDFQRQGAKHRVHPPAVRTKGARQVVKTMSTS